MKLKISARHFELTPEIKDHADKNFDDLQRYFDNIISAQLILNVEKHRKMAELQLKVYGQTLKSTQTTDNMYVSIESVFDKASSQLKKYKGKLKQKNPRRISEAQARSAEPDTDVDSVDF